jgi:predicted metalloprotease with PDZ domain
MDRAFQGTMTLAVDATDTDHGIVAVRETIPVQAAGDVVLLYPEWESASHAPTVPLASLAGLIVTVDGARVPWRRDAYDVHAFHIPVPAGARTLELQFDYIADRGTVRETMASLPWQRVLLYPAGWYASDIPVAASVRLPPGLTAYVALDRTVSEPDVVGLAPTSLDRLVDAPVFAARATRRVDLAPGAAQPVWLDMLADDAASLAIDGHEIEALRNMVAQTERVFGRPPFRHYDAVVLLDDARSAGGIEHLEEGENDLPTRYFLEPGQQLNNRDLIPHELIHAWNGRYRQPADLWTPTFNEPVGGSLLWVYEGQTEFWGRVIAARSALRTKQDTLDRLALDATLVANRPGRAWKSLADSTNDAIYMAGHHVGWREWQRHEDYYSEGVLLWLDVDARLRELTGGTRGLDAFARSFFSAPHSEPVVSTYTFADVCRALDDVAHDDWATFLRGHLDTHSDAEALSGLARAGWRLVYSSEPSETSRQNEAENGGLDLSYAIGAVVDDDGSFESVVWDGPAFRAGLAPGDRLEKIGDAPFSPKALRAAVAATVRHPLALQVLANGKHRSVTLAYDGGLRYPHLARIAGTPDRLSPLLAPR